MVSDIDELGTAAKQWLVLILVIMEYGLGLLKLFLEEKKSIGLNPCYNGIWSRTYIPMSLQEVIAGLNPCYNGIWSRTSTASLSRGS